MAKKVDPVKAKAERQKKIAIVGGVLLLGLLAFQLPRTMKMLHPKGNVTTSAPTTTATTTPGSTPLAPPSLDGSTASSSGTSSGSSSSSSGSSAATSNDGVIDPSTPLPASSGQLISFNRFKSKDPFVQQIQDCGTDACNAPAGSGSSTPSSSGSGGGSSSSPGSNTGGGSSPPPAPGPPTVAKKVTAASISVNGVVSKVAVGGTFPSADPVFVLVSLKPKEAAIGISGGSLQGGATAVGLRLGKTLTLQNTADGTRYVLKLLGTA